MAKVREITEMAAYVRSLTDVGRMAAGRAILRTAVAATTLAKKNAQRNFTGTPDRPKTGNLLNAIFSGFTFGKDRHFAEAMVAVRAQKGRAGTRPYGRIHEFGGDVRPVRAKNLWIPLIGPKTGGAAGRFKNMTPSDVVSAMKKGGKGGRRGRSKGPIEGRFFIATMPSGAKIAGFSQKVGSGKSTTQKVLALYLLRRQVTIPARPYVTPAVEAEYPKLTSRFEAEIKVLMGGKK